jgi:hypothetical protein
VSKIFLNIRSPFIEKNSPIRAAQIEDKALRNFCSLDFVFNLKESESPFQILLE